MANSIVTFPMKEEWEVHQQQAYANQTNTPQYNQSGQVYGHNPKTWGPAKATQGQKKIPWIEEEKAKINSPYAYWNKTTYIVTYYDYTMEIQTPKAVFSTEEEAQKYIDSQPDSEEHHNQGEWDIHELTMDSEVPVYEESEKDVSSGAELDLNDLIDHIDYDPVDSISAGIIDSPYTNQTSHQPNIGGSVPLGNYGNAGSS